VSEDEGTTVAAAALDSPGDDRSGERWPAYNYFGQDFGRGPLILVGTWYLASAVRACVPAMRWSQNITVPEP